jgi:hypothetical protein
MIIDGGKLKQLDGKRPEYDVRYDKREFKSKYQADIIKGIVEIIKNGVDAYINDKGEENCHKEKITVILESVNRKNDFIKIVNFAKGMNSQEFSKAMKVGADTSSDKEGVTGAHGYGMKEAAWAFNQARIISIKEGKYSSRIFYWDEDDSPKYAWDKDDDGKEIIDFSVDEKIKSITGIEKEGTYFEAIIPDGISCPSRPTCNSELSENILLRTINQSERFEIGLGEKDKNGKIIYYSIQYNPPQTLSLRPDRNQIDLGEFSFEYPGYGIINCKYEIFLSKDELSYTGEKREAGILICAGPYSILDCTLFELGGKVESRFFGKAVLTGPIRSICKNEKILDDKRESGLIKKTPLYENLYKRFHKKLEELIEEERKRLNKTTKEISKSLLDNKIDLLKEFNKIDREETEESTDIEGVDKFQPGPNGIRFCVPQDYIKLIEKQSKNVYIVIDTTIISIGSQIELSSKKAGINYDPVKFSVTKEETDSRDIFKKKITFQSDVIDTYLVVATIQDMVNKADLNIDVVSDPRLKIKNPIEFVPSEQDIVAGKEKKFSLIIDYSKIDTSQELKYDADGHLFNLNKHLKILRDSTQIFQNFYELLIPIYCTGRPGQKGDVKIIIGSETAILKLEIIDKRDRHLRGDFKGIKEDDDLDPEVLGYYEPDDKIIYVSRNHPIFRYYRSNKQGEKHIAYRVLYSDVIIREFCKALGRKKVRIFENTSAEDYRVRSEREYEKIYKKHSTRLHKFCVDPKNLESLKVD